MKIVALDLGDRWVGIAISDPLGIIARPHDTVATKQLHQFLENLFSKEQIQTIVVGYPKTLRDTESAQTKRVRTQFDELKKLFPDLTWVLWDERLTSKEAVRMARHLPTKDKLLVHARAAAIILTTYLASLAIQGD